MKIKDVVRKKGVSFICTQHQQFRLVTAYRKLKNQRITGKFSPFPDVYGGEIISVGICFYSTKEEFEKATGDAKLVILN